jgi:hypothetical protein
VILYRLACAAGHEFESWFKDSAAYDIQAAGRGMSCPFCGTTEVSKAIMAPNIARSRETEGRWPPAALDERPTMLRAMAQELRERIVAATEDVGDCFPREARRIQDGEAQARAIRGRASLEEARALLEEGVEILPLPGPPDDAH